MSKSGKGKVIPLLIVLILLATTTTFILTLELEHTYNTAINIEVRNGTILVKYLTWSGKYMPMPPFSIICIGKCRVVSEEPRNITIIFRHGGEAIFRTIAGRRFKALHLTIRATCRNVSTTFKLCNYTRCIQTPILRLREGRTVVEVSKSRDVVKICANETCISVEMYYFTHLYVVFLAHACSLYIVNVSEIYVASP